MKSKTKNKTIPNLSYVHHGLKQLIVPQRKNDYRPHLIRRYSLIAIFVLTIGLQFGIGLFRSNNVLGSTSDITVSSLLVQTNQERIKDGEPLLRLNDKLIQAAILKANDMYKNQYWDHTSPQGTPPWKWLNDVGYNYDVAGENLAKNFDSTKAVMAAWMASPEHKANILKPEYKEVGFAIVYGKLNGQPTSLIVAFYGQPDSRVVVGSTFSSATADKSAIVAKLAEVSKSLTMFTIAGSLLICLAIIVAVWTHLSRCKLPAKLYKTWYRHHGFYKFLGLTTLAVMFILFSVKGQI